MTNLRRIRLVAPLWGFAALLLLPGAAMRGGLMSFDYRFEALLAVSALTIGVCALAGFTRAELGLSSPWIARHWLNAGAITLLLAAGVAFEADLIVGAAREEPKWIAFAPFYVLVSSPCQEVVCRSIPKLITDRMEMSGRNYVLFSATVFSLMHSGYGEPVLLANTFFAGLAWGAAYLFTRNIWPIVASHAVVGMLAFSLGVA